MRSVFTEMPVEYHMGTSLRPFICRRLSTWGRPSRSTLTGDDRWRRAPRGGGWAAVIGVLFLIGLIIKFIWWILGALALVAAFYLIRAAVRQNRAAAGAKLTHYIQDGRMQAPASTADPPPGPYRAARPTPMRPLRPPSPPGELGRSGTGRSPRQKRR